MHRHPSLHMRHPPPVAHSTLHITLLDLSQTCTHSDLLSLPCCRPFFSSISAFLGVVVDPSGMSRVSNQI